MGKFKYITMDKQRELELYKFIEISSKSREIKRALAILMSGENKSVSDIAKRLDKNPDTVYDWLINFTNSGIEGLKDKPMPRRPKRLNNTHAEKIKETFLKSA